MSLKAKYNKKLKAISKKNTCLKSYLIFSQKLMENGSINNIQKLNTILKINDMINLQNKNILYQDTHTLIKKNISFERDLISNFV